MLNQNLYHHKFQAVPLDSYPKENYPDLAIRFLQLSSDAKTTYIKIVFSEKNYTLDQLANHLGRLTMDIKSIAMDSVDSVPCSRESSGRSSQLSSPDLSYMFREEPTSFTFVASRFSCLTPTGIAPPKFDFDRFRKPGLKESDYINGFVDRLIAQAKEVQKSDLYTALSSYFTCVYAEGLPTHTTSFVSHDGDLFERLSSGFPDITNPIVDRLTRAGFPYITLIAKGNNGVYVKDCFGKYTHADVSPLTANSFDTKKKLDIRASLGLGVCLFQKYGLVLARSSFNADPMSCIKSLIEQFPSENKGLAILSHLLFALPQNTLLQVAEPQSLGISVCGLGGSSFIVSLSDSVNRLNSLTQVKSPDTLATYMALIGVGDRFVWMKTDMPRQLVSTKLIPFTASHTMTPNTMFFSVDNRGPFVASTQMPFKRFIEGDRLTIQMQAMGEISVIYLGLDSKQPNIMVFETDSNEIIHIPFEKNADIPLHFARDGNFSDVFPDEVIASINFVNEPAHWTMVLADNTDVYIFKEGGVINHNLGGGYFMELKVLAISNKSSCPYVIIQNPDVGICTIPLNASTSAFNMALLSPAEQRPISQLARTRPSHVTVEATVKEFVQHKVKITTAESVNNKKVKDSKGRYDHMEDFGIAVEIDGGSHGSVVFTGVFDGHGTPDISSVLGERLKAKFESAFKKLPSDPINDDFVTMVRGVFSQVSSDIFSDRLVGGSTAVIALIVKDKVIVANCGDSGAVVEYKDGTVQEVSFEHSAKNALDIRLNHVVFKKSVRDVYRLHRNFAIGRSFGDTLGHNRHKEVASSKPGMISDPFVVVLSRDTVSLILLRSDGVDEGITQLGACPKVFPKDYLSIAKIYSPEVLVEQALIHSTDNIMATFIELIA